MSGQFSYEGDDETPSLASFSAQVGVYRYDPDAARDQDKLELLPNVRVLSVEAPGEGPLPGSARFRYAAGDPLGDPDDPQRFEQVYPLDAEGARVVRNDDRLIVKVMLEGGSTLVLFDGFVQLPQLDLGADIETVTFEAVGTPIREWDKPLGGALMRDADDPSNPEANVQTSLPARMNPAGHPNATDDGADYVPDPDENDDRFPVFLNEVWPPVDVDPDSGEPVCKINGSIIRPWTIAMAARYVVGLGNKDQEYVDNPSLMAFEDVLVALVPKSDGGSVDVEDADSYTVEPIDVEDFDVRGAPWPEALYRLIDPYGFAMRFVLEDSEPDEDGYGGGLPSWSFDVYRRDLMTPVKSLYLQEAGDTLDLSKTNLAQASLARDASDIANQWVIDTGMVLVEASLVLAPLFKIDPSDAAAGNLSKWRGDNAPAAYREWGLDEAGEGHWSFSANSWVENEPGHLDRVLDPKDEEGGSDKRPFVHRRRPGIGQLISTDGAGKPLKARLHISKNPQTDAPGVWDGGSESSWQLVSDAHWSLLPDRLGIRIVGDDPNAWTIGQDDEADSTAVFPQGGLLNLVKWCATPTARYPVPWFRLTCVIEMDMGLDVTVKRRAASVTRFAVERRYDASDRWRKRVISKFSCLADPFGPTAQDTVKEDDSKDAKSFAQGMQRARETSTFSGTVTLMGIQLGYSVGDHIDKIVGRDVSLQQNLGTGTGESPIYPTIVGIRWNFDGSQTTTLMLSDRRGEPPARRRRSRRA